MSDFALRCLCSTASVATATGRGPFEHRSRANAGKTTPLRSVPGPIPHPKRRGGRYPGWHGVGPTNRCFERMEQRFRKCGRNSHDTHVHVDAPDQRRTVQVGGRRGDRGSNSIEREKNEDARRRKRWRRACIGRLCGDRSVFTYQVV